MKKKKKMIASIALLVVLTGCSSISEGTVMDKHYYEGYHSTTYICSAYNKGMCIVNVPITNWNPERWVLDLEEGDKDGHVSVSKPVFDQYSIGDYYRSEQ